jgi:hypothetical protein
VSLSDAVNRAKLQYLIPMAIPKSSDHVGFGDRLYPIMAAPTTGGFRCAVKDSINVLS